MAVTIHLIAALWALLAGFSQLITTRGTKRHKLVGWSWMVSMVIVAVSSFWLTGFMDLLWGFSPIHLLSIWVLVCVVVSFYSAQTGNIRRHRRFAIGAFYGVVGAAIGTLAPGRLIHQWFFG